MKQLRWIGSLMLDRSSVAWGFLNAVRADEDFVNAVQTAIVSFHEEFETLTAMPGAAA